MKPIHFLLLCVLLSCGRALAQQTATAVATVTAGFITGVTVTSGGSGYTVEPTVTVSGGGGSGASAKAILSGDKVVAVIVLTAGSGYATVPSVAIQPPPDRLGLKLELVPKLTVLGPAGSSARVDWAENVSGPWTAWTNVVIASNGVVLVDLAPGAVARFYQSVSVTPVGPPGFVWIPPGTFMMGSPTNEGWRRPDEFLHQVTLTKGFWMCDHEVTQGEWAPVMGVTLSDKSQTNLPVDSFSMGTAVEFCHRLTDLHRVNGKITRTMAYRLPTEAEWEYSARAGSSLIRYGDLDAIAWHAGNGDGVFHPVKLKTPNAWGLFDMFGNVSELCSDWYGDYPQEPSIDPKGLPRGVVNTVRGGNVGSYQDVLRAAARTGFPGAFGGLRLVLDWVE